MGCHNLHCTICMIMHEGNIMNKSKKIKALLHGCFLKNLWIWHKKHQTTPCYGSSNGHSHPKIPADQNLGTLPAKLLEHLLSSRRREYQFFETYLGRAQTIPLHLSHVARYIILYNIIYICMISDFVNRCYVHTHTHTSYEGCIKPARVVSHSS